VVRVQEPQRGKSIQSFAAIRHQRSATKEFSTVIDQSVAITIKREPGIGRGQPANSLGPTIGIDVKDRTSERRNSSDAISIKIQRERF
jgi:hypothetical protein